MLKTVIVDDEAQYREELLEILNCIEIVEIIEVCAGAREVLSLLEQNPPHIIFLDIHLPGMNGLELAGLLREKYPGVSVILMAEDKNFALESFEAGASYYLLKPFRPAQVQKALKGVRVRGQAYI